MKIALINSEYPCKSSKGHGGIATYTYQMAQALSENGHQVHIFVRDSVKPEIQDKNITTHVFSYKPVRKKFLKVISKLTFKSPELEWERGQSRFIRDQLLLIHKTSGLDIAEFPDYGGLAHECGSISKFAVVVNFHTPTSIVDQYNNTPITKKIREIHKFERNALKKADGFRCPGKSFIDEICGHYKIDNASVNYIKNPLFTNAFDSLPKKHLDNSKIDILFSGRLEKRKGAEILLQNINSILNLDKKIHFTISCETCSGTAKSYREQIEQSLEPNNRARVSFTGSIGKAALYRLYCNSSILFFPSVFENAPYTLYEAMAAGLPVAANSCHGVTDIIVHKKNGMLFDQSNPETIIKSIKTLITNKNLYEKISHTAYNTVKSDFSPQQIALQSIKFYQSVISKKK